MAYDPPNLILPAFQLSADDTHRTETFGPMEVGDACEVSFAQAARVMAEQRRHLVEKDPTGRDPHAKGAKLDAGKPAFDMTLCSFPLSLAAVNKVGQDGANKYTKGGFLEVPDGQRRYMNADIRHKVKHLGGELIDADTGSLHLAHAAWNALAALELYLRENA